MKKIYSFHPDKLKNLFVSVFIVLVIILFPITNTFSQQTITGTTAANEVLILKGAASQSGNLQNWQNSAGTNLAFVDASGNFTVPSLRLNNTNTNLTQGSGNAIKVTTNSGYVELGPQNTGWCHFTTDRTQFYFNKQVGFNGHAFPYTDNTFDLGNSSANAWRDLYLDRMIYANGTAGANGQVLTSNGTNVYWAAAAGGSDNLGNHTATTDLNMGNFSINSCNYYNVTAGAGYGLQFWSSPSYAINMGSGGEWAYGAVTGYSIKMNMNNDATRGWTWGIDGLTPVASINTQGIFSLANEIKIDGNTVIDDGGGWHRSYGATGWYNGTYGGGWYMSDGTWIRSYGSKYVYCDQIIRADAGFQVDGNTVIDDGAGWHRSYGATGWYNGTYGGGIWMNDATWVRVYNGKNFICDASIQMGDATTDAHNFWGTLKSGSQSDSHIIIPYAGNWGYVGNSTYYWYYSYAGSHVNMSKRELKRDITVVQDNLNELIMNDIDNIKPSFYKFKDETDVMEKDLESRYRPNMHLGVILDESPDYIQDNAFSGIDIYALATMTLVGVKNNRAEIKEIKEQIGMSDGQVEVHDFGVSSINGKKVVITFNKDFKGSVPVVTVTPNSLNVSLAVTEISSSSFTVESSQELTNVSINWIALGYTKTEISAKTTEPVSDELMKSLKVDQSIKDKIDQYWKVELPAKQKAEEQKANEKVIENESE